MALTDLQRRICRLLAQDRIASGESYVAGGVALNEFIAASRLSRDIDLFHDTDEALDASWQADRASLESHGFGVRVVRSRPTFIEAEVADGRDRVHVEWARGSAFRFFLLRLHDEFGLTLDAFDLATNRVLALVGRLEVRDSVDVIACDERVQPLGYLAWAASAKDPGFGPGAILEAAARSTRYSAEEVAGLSFDGVPPDAAELARSWHRILDRARPTIALLPPDEVGACILDTSGGLIQAAPDELAARLRAGEVSYHHGRIGGAMPRVLGA
jgi:hypothetical protein